MINITIDMNPLVQRLLKAVAKVDGNAFYYCGSPQRAGRMLALRFIDKVRADIVANAYAGKWGSRARRYAPRYDWWKHVTMGKSGRFWDLYGDLISKVQVFQVQNNEWMVGVPEGIMDSGGKSWFGVPGNLKGKSKSIAMYGNVLEFGMRNTGGSGDHPARPIFEPAMINFAYNESPIVGDNILSNVAKDWT